jgi:phosphohistidine phosphatase
MKLYMMRHGPAEEDAASGHDADRALTTAGRERVIHVAKALIAAGEGPREVLTSPLVRAVQTAEIVAIVTHAANLRVRREVAPGGDGARLAHFLASGGQKRVMLVGHEPDLSELLSALVGVPLARPFDKAMVTGLHLSRDSGEARLRFVLDPRTLRLETSP